MSNPPSASAIAAVRSFSRLVTQRVGALDDRYLSRSRPLGQARVLWEIGRDGCEVGVLRARLGLDSAQLSRTLRTLEADALIEVVPHAQDGRVRVATLTAVGSDEWAELEAGSDAAARTILDSLSPRQRARLVDTMAEVERLVTASMVQIDVRPPSDPQARMLLRAYAQELEHRFEGPFESGGGDDDMVAPHGVFLIATLQSEPVACGGLKLHAHRIPEIKRLWSAPAARGLGLGRRLMAELERHARDAGAAAVRLDTNASLTEAMALYRSIGYREIARYNDNPHAQHWFEKEL